MNTKKEKLGRGLNSRAKEVRREYVEGGIRLAHVLKLAEETSLPDTTPLVFGLADYWHRSRITAGGGASTAASANGSRRPASKSRRSSKNGRPKAGGQDGFRHRHRDGA